MKSASSTQLVREIQVIKEWLRKEPVSVTTHGKEDFILVSPENYAALAGSADTDVSRLDTKINWLMNSVGSMILIMDDDMNVIRVNRALCNFMEMEEDDLLGKPMASLCVHPTDHYLVLRAKTVLESGKEESFEFESARRNGRTMRYLVRPWPNGVGLVTEDITEYAQTSDWVMQLDACDQSLAGLPGIGTCSVDENGKIIIATKNLAAMVGTSKDALIDVSLFTLLSTQSRGTVERALQYRGTETKTLAVDYARNGKSFERAVLSITPYSNSVHKFCFALALHDSAWPAQS